MLITRGMYKVKVSDGYPYDKCYDEQLKVKSTKNMLMFVSLQFLRRQGSGLVFLTSTKRVIVKFDPLYVGC